MKMGSILEDETIASLIGFYGKQQKLKHAKDLFMAVRDSSSGKIICNAMIDAYAKCGKPEEAYKLYKESTEKGHVLGAVSISIVVNSLTNSGTSFFCSFLNLLVIPEQY